jgi:hypothetical protein
LFIKDWNSGFRKFPLPSTVNVFFKDLMIKLKLTDET